MTVGGMGFIPERLMMMMMMIVRFSTTPTTTSPQLRTYPPHRHRAARSSATYLYTPVSAHRTPKPKAQLAAWKPRM